MPISSIDISFNPVTKWELYQRTFYPKHRGISSDFAELDREKLADGGFGRVRLKIFGTRPELEEFFEYGLGRHIVITSQSGRTDYEGFVHDMVLNTGSHLLRKSMRNIVNKIWARYDATGGVSPTQRSTIFQDIPSQLRFGVIEKVIGGGQQSGITAINQAVSNKLTLIAWPIIDPDFGAGSGDPYIEIVGVGYNQTLNWRTYNQTALTGNTDISIVATAVIAACGQFIASSEIAANVIQVPREYDVDSFAYDILESLAAMGDSAANRWLSRVLQGRVYKLGPASRVR